MQDPHSSKSFLKLVFVNFDLFLFFYCLRKYIRYSAKLIMEAQLGYPFRV